MTHEYPARTRHMALRAAMKALATMPTLSRTAAVARVAPRGSRPHPSAAEAPTLEPKPEPVQA